MQTNEFLHFAVEVAVIDEIQMIKDQNRGWAWTRALLGKFFYWTRALFDKCFN